MRDLWSMRNAPYLAAKEAEAINFTLSMMLCQQLHTEADTKKWLTLLGRLANSIIQATLGHTRHSSTARTDTRKHDRLSFGDNSRIIRYPYGCSGIFQSLLDAVNIASTVINKSN